MVVDKKIKVSMSKRLSILEERKKLKECRPDPHKDPIGEHEWRMFKQHITNDLSHYSGPHSYYFVVKACTKCHLKEYIDLKK